MAVEAGPEKNPGKVGPGEQASKRKAIVMGLIYDIERRVGGGVTPQNFYDPNHPLTMEFGALRQAVEDLTSQLGDLRGSNNHRQEDPSLLKRFMLLWRR